METGFILIDKPAKITSHDVVDKLRYITKIRKIGHAGTLDPFATGLLILAVSRGATKYIQELVGLDKVYEADFILGATSDSLDPETDVMTSEKPLTLTEDDVRIAMSSLTGDIEQIPPMHSAIKIGGKRLYKLAREGKEIERKPRSVSIYAFELLHFEQVNTRLIQIKVRIHCSSGTYIRALSRDLAIELGTTGYTKTLRRTKIGKHDIADAIKLSEVTEENWLTLLKSHQEMGIDAS